MYKKSPNFPPKYCEYSQKNRHSLSANFTRQPNKKIAKFGGKIAHLATLVITRVARLALLGPNFRNLVPNNTCWPQNFHLALWFFFGPFQDRLGSGLDRTGSGLKPILVGSGLDRTAIFFENWRNRTGSN